MAPEVRVGAIEEDATHARFGRIGCAEEERIFGDNFGQVGGTVGEVKRKKIKEAVTDLFRDAYSVGRGSQIHGALQRREEGCRAGHCVADEPEFSHRAGPTFSADAARGGEVLEQRRAGLTAVRREFDGPSFRVENPPKYQLSRCPATVAVTELLDGDGFVAELGRQRCVKDVVDGVEKVISHPGQPGGPALPEQDEVIDKHIGMSYGQLVGSVG